MTSVIIHVSPSGDGTVVQIRGGGYDATRMGDTANFSDVPQGVYQVYVRRDTINKTQDLTVSGEDVSLTVHL
jgi:hypothetical protein